MLINTSSLSHIKSYEDPSLYSHLQTIHVETKNLPKLKYSLACIVNSLAYNNSNRHYNIAAVAKPKTFKQIVSLLVHFQDQKILQESLSILNVILNQGNDLTVQQESEIMHSLSYVNVNNQTDKGFISDKLVQEILYLTYKLKTKLQLSQFVSTLMAEKMTGSQAKKFIKELKKQQLKNIKISDLIKIGFKFKTNVLLMNEILNLIYEKVFGMKDQYETKKLFQFLPKIVQQNIDEQSISYKCLQIYKIVHYQYPSDKLDSLVDRYLSSLLKYKKQLFLPLKRQFVVNEQQFMKILQFGTQFQIYHLLVMDYLIRNGYKGGKQSWRQYLYQNRGSKNMRLKEICLRIQTDRDSKYQQINNNIKQSQQQMTESDQRQFLSLLPIQTLRYPNTILQKLLAQPTISNCLFVIKNLCYYSKQQQLLLTIHKIALKQKEFNLVKQIQKIVKQAYSQQFVYEQLKNIYKVKHKVVLKGQLYFIWLPVVSRNEQKLKQLQTELIDIMGYDSIEIQDKFYVMELMIENRMDKVVKGFLLYLNRQLQAVNAMEEGARQQGEVLFNQIKYYLKQWTMGLKSNTNVVNFYLTQLMFYLQRTAQLLFSKLTQFRSQTLTGALFQLENWNFYSENWRLSYRWILTALQEINQQNAIFTLDCLQLLEMAIENIHQNLIPQSAKDRFMKILVKNWSRFQSQHLFAIERIVNIIWPNHQFPILSSLKPIKPISQLISQQQQFNKKNEYFFQSEHPTSLFLQNLQMSHFFGIVSQQQFVKNILLLYDKRFNQTKRFTQKNVISLMNFMIWLYQYSEQDMQKGLCDMTMGFLSYKSQTVVNDISSYNIRKKCIEIISVVSHSINLLKLPLKQLLEVYIGQSNVMGYLNEIIQTIIQSKASYISQLKLDTIVESIMIGLVTCENLQLIEEYIDFIEAVCYIEESPYAAMFEQSLSTLYQILKAEHKMVQKYRKSLVQFVVDILRHYQYQIQSSILWLLMSKYFVEEQLQVSILECLVKNLQEERGNQSQSQNKIKLSYDNEKLLVRLIMHHNQHPEIIRMAQSVLQNSEKQQLERVDIDTNSNNKESKNERHAIKNTVTQQQHYKQQVSLSSPEQQFTQLFSQQLYSSCQQLLPQLRNPFIIIAKQQIELFLKQNQQLESYQFLLNFFIKNPHTRTDLLSIKEFYCRKQCVEELMNIVEGLRWNQEGLEKLDVKLFDKQQLIIEFQPSAIQLTVKAAISSLLTTPSIKPKLIFFLNKLKSTKHQLYMLELYSKCLPQTNNKLLFEIISNLGIEKGLQLMRLNMNYQLNNVSDMACDWLLYHLFVHVEGLPFMGTAELDSEERYIRDVVQLICQNELEKNITAAHHFFINLISKLPQILPSHKVAKQIVDLANCYLMVFESGQGGLKNRDIKQTECAAILSALLFLLKNGENIHVGIAGKVIQQVGDKLGDNAVLKQIHQYLTRAKPLTKQVLQQQKSQQKKLLQQPKKKFSSLTSSLGQKSREQQNVVFAKESPKSQQPQTVDKQQQVSQAFKKGKVLQQYMSVGPRQMKALAEKQKDAQQGVQNKAVRNKQQQAQQPTTTNVVISVEQSIQQTDSQQLIRPRDIQFEQSSFYDPISSRSQSSLSSTNDRIRRQLLVSIRLKQNEQISIATLKEHAKFISSLLEYDKLSREETQELMKSIDNITSTVNQHHYYVKKLVQLQVTFKLIKLYKRKDSIFLKELSREFGAMFESKLLTLHHAMSYKKEKKTIIFDDQLTIEFFKLIIKKSLTYKKSRNQNIVILEIVSYCIKSIDSFFKQGLMSMLIELIKNDINDEEVLKFFCKIQLSKHIIFEIYQRGLLNKFVEVFIRKDYKESVNVTVINRWIRLAGKICTTVAIQQKYIQKQIHKLVWQKHNEILQQDLQSKKSVAFFFACLGKKNHKVFEFMVQNGVLEKLLSSLQSQNSEELYTMFYSIGVENTNAMEYFFRIKYHVHLLEQLLPKTQHKVKSKFFYKSLGQIMSSKQHQALFFKEQTIHKLIKQYELKPQPSIYECLLDFIVTLENDKQFEELKKQGFWECLGLFEYKLSSEATYAYILQIFLVMIKKGRIKQFNTPQIRGKVTLKAEYSINLEGKELALRFVTALSIRTKQCYITERCIRLLSSLVGFKVTSNELDLIEDMLDVEGMIDNHQFMEFCSDYEVTQNICVRFKTFNEKQLLSALKILNILGTEAKNNKILREKLFMPAMDMLKQQLTRSKSSLLIQQWLFKLILVIVMYKQSKQSAQRLEFGNFLLEIIDKILTKDPNERKKNLDEYVAIVEICRQNSVLPLTEMDKILDKLNKSKAQKEVGRISQIKQTLQGDMETQSNQMIQAMAQGTTVKMYKSDGSSSELVLFLAEDKLELNCAIEKGQPVKQKWRLVLSEIYEIQSFEDEKKYEISAFYKSGGLFSRPPDKKLCLTAKSKNNEFNILFNKKEDKDRWKKYIQLAAENSKKILKQFK